MESNFTLRGAHIRSPFSAEAVGPESLNMDMGTGECSRSSSHWHDWLSRNLSAHRYDLITNLIKFIDRQQLQQRVAIIWDISWKGWGWWRIPFFLWIWFMQFYLFREIRNYYYYIIIISWGIKKKFNFFPYVEGEGHL